MRLSGAFLCHSHRRQPRTPQKTNASFGPSRPEEKVDFAAMLNLLKSATSLLSDIFLAASGRSGFLGQGEITWEDQFRFQA
jgi:hypothetical protein